MEKEGIDVDAVNRLALSYWRQFGQELPHPKMDALVRSLRSSFATGDKALVFVRRVASVKELKQKLESAYDIWLKEKLRRELRHNLQTHLESLFKRYSKERRTSRPPSAEQQVHEPNDLELDYKTEPRVRKRLIQAAMKRSSLGSSAAKLRHA